MKKLIDKLRLKLGSLIIGNQVALILPKEDIEAAKEDNLNLDDHKLAAMTRWWFHFIRQSNNMEANAKNIPINVYLTSHGILNLVRVAVSANAETMNITQQCFIKGEDVGNWNLTLTKMPDDYDYGENGVQIEHDGEKIKELRMTYNLTELRN